MRRRLPLSLPLLMMMQACGGDIEIRPDSRSGDDFERAGAQQLFLDKLTDDYLDAKKGDNTDWKYFKIPAKGILTLTTYWDDKDVDSVIDVRDRFGVLVDSRKHSPELEKDVMELRVEPGTHFVRLNAAAGASVYTIEGLFQPFDFEGTDDFQPTAVDDGDPLGGMGEPVPEAIPMDTGRPTKQTGPRRVGPPGPAVPKPVAEQPSGKSQSGTIIRMIPGAGGGKTYTMLTLNVGTASGVSQNDRGVLLDDDNSAFPGGNLQIVSVSEKSSQARTNLTQAQIAHRRRVKIFIK